MNEVTLDKITYILGEEKPVRVSVVHERGIDISSGTASIIIYDSVGATTLASTAMTVGTGRPVVASYQLTTGSGKNITASGEYRAIVTFTYSGVIQRWQIPITVKSAPS